MLLRVVPLVQMLPRKSVRLTCENKSVYTEFVPTFRNFDFYLGRMLTYEHFKRVRSDYFSCGPLCPTILRGCQEEKEENILQNFQISGEIFRSDF